MIDLKTREVRTPMKADVDEATLFLDALDQVIVFERPLTPNDMDQEICSLYNTKAFLNSCTKHGYIGINSVENMRTC